ncbi:hypothetical protein Rcae01_04610 [Novipirellula caenicola]|uniref:Uncharacterized protein n=2 Tax=Novipirellula caenicola TaxID=1536901 RepID=A0ABP9VX27_9BACT
MENESTNESTLAGGIGAGLVALLGMFARCADDVARIGVHSVDDVGRMSVSTGDDFARAFSNSSDDIVRVSDDFRFADDFAVHSETRFTPVAESHDGAGTALHVTKDVAEITVRLVKSANRDDDQ